MQHLFLFLVITLLVARCTGGGSGNSTNPPVAPLPASGLGYGGNTPDIFVEAFYKNPGGSASASVVYTRQPDVGFAYYPITGDPIPSGTNIGELLTNQGADPLLDVQLSSDHTFVTHSASNYNLHLENHHIFATSAIYPANFGGYQNAITLCNTRAQAGSITRDLPAKNWYPILSTNSINANSLVFYPGAALKNTGGTGGILVANNADALWNAANVPLLSSIRFDENGTNLSLSSVAVWTGSNANGTVFTNNGAGVTCSNWTVWNSSGDFGRLGVLTMTLGSWLSSSSHYCEVNDNPHTLFLGARLYCVNVLY